MALISKETGYTQTQTIEPFQKRNVRANAIDIIEKSCLLNNISFKSQSLFAREMLKTNRTLPIAVNLDRGIVLFPTCSYKSPDCQWFAYYHIKDYKQVDHKTCVYFKHTADVFYTNVSIKAFDAQYKKAGEIIAKHCEKFFFADTWL